MVFLEEAVNVLCPGMILVPDATYANAEGTHRCGDTNTRCADIDACDWADDLDAIRTFFAGSDCCIASKIPIFE